VAESHTSSSTWTGPIRPPAAPPFRVAVRTLGCKVNRVESERIAADLLGRGCDITAEEDAAIIVINTCAVTTEAEAKARKAARHAAELPNRPVVVVTGCASTVAAEQMAAVHERVVVESDKEAVAGRVAALLGAPATPEGPPLAAEDTFRTRHMLKVEDGCDSFCAYCIVPYARGLPRSVPLAQVRREAAECAAAGVREIVVTGINVGRYADDGATLPDLMAAVFESGVERVRLSSVEPLDVGERLLAVYREHSATAAPHLHVPLQSGSDRVLQAMGRGYTVSEYERRIEAAREAVPGLAVTTDVMVGFPGETDEDARLTREACDRIGFSKLHVFRYSPRPGTRAVDLPSHVPAAVAGERAAELRALGERLAARYAGSRAGGTAHVLVERVRGDEAEGTSEDYLKVTMHARGVDIGEIVAVRLLGRSRERVLAEVL